MTPNTSSKSIHASAKIQKTQSTKLAWLSTADMGYGHQRAIFPFQSIGHEGIITVGDNSSTPNAERTLWKRMLSIYEFLSRAKGIPLIGHGLFKILDTLLYIPSLYPERDLSSPTFQVKLLANSIRKGLCQGLTQKIKQHPLPLLTSFYAPALAADYWGHHKIYCIICDSDLNRVWVAPNPWESRIDYFAPCGRAARRLKLYGVPENRIHLTGFPFPLEILGSEELEILKADLGQRLHYLDPNKRFMPLHQRDMEYFLGKENLIFRQQRILTLTYAVGGAGAQKETGRKIAVSLRKLLNNNHVLLNLVAGTRSEIKDYFLDIKEEIDSPNIQVVYGKSKQEYFEKFNRVIRHTDILWTKPSELSFYCALGIPIIMSPTIGAQEQANKAWLREIHAGIPQHMPEFTDQWLMDMLHKGLLAGAAWQGFLRARKKGTFNILRILQTGDTQIPRDLIR